MEDSSRSRVVSLMTIFNLFYCLRSFFTRVGKLYGAFLRFIILCDLGPREAYSLTGLILFDIAYSKKIGKEQRFSFVL